MLQTYKDKSVKKYFNCFLTIGQKEGGRARDKTKSLFSAESKVKISKKKKSEKCCQKVLIKFDTFTALS